MKLARPLRRSPLDIAEALAASLRAGGGNPLARLGRGRAARVRQPARGGRRVRGASWRGSSPRPTQWGRIPAVNPRSVNVEFVSANPTGPLTVGNARGAFVGDLLCRVLEAGGQSVTREYYFNDSGAQVTHLGDSVVAVRRGEPVPEDGYKGAYVEDAGRRAARRRVGRGRRPTGANAGGGRRARGRARACARASRRRSTRLGVRFDVWKSEALAP